jgi:hypothetical protein
MELARENVGQKTSMQECGDNIQTENANILRHKICCVSRNILKM